MARDGSGNYSRPVADYVFNTTIDETKVNQEFDQVATALTDSIAKDGQTDPTANLPMAGYKHTGVAVASARDEYADVAAVQDGDYVFGGDAGGTATALTCALSPSITAYADGMRIWLITGSAATGASTLNANGIGAKSIVDSTLNAIQANAWQSGMPICLVYEAGNDHFILVAPVPYIITTDGNVHIFSGSAGSVAAAASGDELVVEGPGNTGISILAPAASNASIFFGDPTNSNQDCEIRRDTSRGLNISTALGDRLNIGVNGGEVVWNNPGLDINFRIEGDTNENLFFLDAGNDVIVVGDSTAVASAILACTSTTKGFLPPRGTSTQRDNISTPAENLLFGNSTDKTLDHYNGTSWKPLVRGWTNSGSIDLTNSGANDLTLKSLLSGASNVNEIEIHISGFSTNTANQAPMLQIGDSGGYETSGYTGNAVAITSATVVSANSAGFFLSEETVSDAATTTNVIVRLTHMGSNVWACRTTGSNSGNYMIVADGIKTLSAALDRVQITTSGGTATFDGGTAYLRWR